MGELVKFNKDRLLLLGFIVEQKERVRFSDWDSDSLVDSIENLLNLKQTRFRSVKDALLNNMRNNNGELLMCHYSPSDNCYLFSDGQIQLDLGSLLCIEHRLNTIYGHVHSNGYFIRDRGIYFDIEYSPKLKVTAVKRDTKKANLNGKRYKQIK